MGCGGSSEEKSAPPEVDVDDEETVGDDAHPAAASEVPLPVAPAAGQPEEEPEEWTCKFGCGRLVAPPKGDRRFDTCCKACATSKNHDQHDATCRGYPSVYRQVCSKGAKCRQRTAEHLAAFAHPLDKDYAKVCTACGLDYEPLSLRNVFDWMDADGSGKLSREELTDGIQIVGDLRGDEPEDRPVITDKCWKQVDEDGNGVVNFTEFACWAGPRWGLPLGLKRASSSAGECGRCCTVINCPCTDFVPGTGAMANTCMVCRHTEHKHKPPASESEVDYPPYWDNRLAGKHEMVQLGSRHVADFQDLFNSCYKKKWTRDRKRHNPENPLAVPKQFRVLRAYRNENCDLWGEYFARLTVLEHQVREALGGEEGAEQIEVWHESVRTARSCSKFQQGDTLNHDCNEWYLLHGTNPKAAKAICTSDFKIHTAGSNTGTLYGRGLYFADSITKADEYSKPNDKGVYAVLLCRVLGGKVLYNDEVTPDPEELVQQCVCGPYDTVLGDREKCRNTFKEFVLFDTEDVFPEYVIEYERVY